MGEKKLKLVLDLDDRSFNSAVKRMQDQLNQIQTGPAMIQQQRQISQKMQQMGLGGLPGVSNERQSEQAQQKAKQQTDKLLRDTLASMAIIKREQNELNKELEKGLLTEEKKLKIRERLKELQKEELRSTGELKTIVDTRQSGIQHDNKQFGGKLLGAAGVIGGASEWMRMQARLPLEAAEAQGTAATSLVGQQIKDMTDPYKQAFLPERQKSIEMAKKAWQSERINDKIANAVGTVAIGIGLAGLATAETLSGGLATPGVIAGGAALLGMATNSKQRALTAGNEGAYEQLSAADLADLTNRSIKAGEEANPLKKMAAEYNAQNYQRNLGAQRGLGLSDKEFMGRSGFLQGNMAPGGNMQFTEDQVMQMQQSIMGAGGSARMGRQAGFGLQLQKNLDLTNAPQLLGTLSKTMGGASETKEASIRVITEAFKQGLNDSQLVDLLRSFTQVTGEYITRSGAKTQEDATRIAAQFGKGLQENTGVGMEAAKTAYDAYQGLSGQVGGPFSVMQRASMLSNPSMKRLAGMGVEGSRTFEALKKTKVLTQTHQAVQEAVYLLNKNLKPGETPVTAQDIMGIKESSTAAGADITGDTGKYNKIVQQWEQANGMSISEGIRKGIVSPEIAHAARQAGLSVSALGTGSMSGLETEQELNAGAATLRKAIPGVVSPADVSRMASYGGSERSADQVNANVAAGQQAFIDNFEKFKNDIVPTANNISDLNKQLVLLGQIAADIASGKNPNKGDLGKAATSMVKEQPQADSSSSNKGRGASAGW